MKLDTSAAKGRPILFVDFDGTLCTDRYWRSLPKEEYDQIQKILFEGEKTLVSQWMLGKYTAEEITDFVSKRLNIPHERLWEAFQNDCKTMSILPSVLEKLKLLHKHFTLVLMTVNTDGFSRFTSPSLRLEEYFDVISNSWEEKMHKADNGGELFTRYARRFGVDVKDCVLIDDSLRNCEVFETLGGEACRVTPTQGVGLHLDRFSVTPPPSCSRGGPPV